MTDPLPPTPPLSDLLHAILEQEDFDQAFIIAGALNLYFDSIRRQGTRNHIGPEDVFKILTIIRLLLAASSVEQALREVTGAPRKKLGG